MSEFKFSCPNCQQNIQATPEYSGLQINCPSCQTPLIVPQAPGAPPPAPPSAPHGPRLSKSASSQHAPAPLLHYTLPPVPKKKSKTGLIAGWSIAACAVAAMILFGQPLLKKYGILKQDTPLEQPVPKPVKPPPPPELTTEEIMDKVKDSYQNLSDYAAKAETTGALDMSGLVPGQGVMNITTHSSLQLGRTNFYRLEWHQNVGGKNISGAAWNAGKGDFVGYGGIAPKKVKSRQEAMAPAGASFLLSALIAETFFSTTNGLTAHVSEFTKTNGPAVNGQPSYVLLGEVAHQSLLIWINKKSFLLSQVEVILGGKMDEAELKKLPLDQRNAMMIMSKLKGTIIESYDSIQTNQNLMASAFTTTYTPSAAPGAAPQQASSKAERLTNPTRRGRNQ
jgi:hypothetical protein